MEGLMLQPEGGKEGNVFTVGETYEKTQGGCCHNNVIFKDGKSDVLYCLQT
jgi:hypothetical protein